MSARKVGADKLLWETLERWKRSSPELDRIKFLKTVPFFNELSDRQLKIVSGILFERRYEIDELVFEEGQPGAALFLILDGKVAVEMHRENHTTKLVMNSPEEKPGMLVSFIQKQTGPLMDKVNQLLELDPKEREQFLRYSTGYFIENKIIRYFQANQNMQKYATPEESPGAALTTTATVATPVEPPPAAREGSSWEPWILAPLIFIFLGFDNGQIRRYFISLVPNRYFELSLTLLDRLDSAIGKYLRGTLTECALVGATLCLGLILLGSPVGIAMAVGLVCGLVNAIPMLGTVIALVICLGYALIAENVEPLIPGLNPNNLPLYVVILVGITHVMDDVVFQPFVLGSAVNIHPLVVVLAIIGGSLVMGLWGMLFAIPTVVVVKTVVETLFKELKDYRIV